MKTKELKAIIETAEQLGHDDIGIFIDESRDGEEYYVPAKARLHKTTNPHDYDTVILVIHNAG